MKKNSLEIIKKTKNELTTPEDMKMKIREYIDKLNDSSTRDLYFKNFKNLLLTYTDEKSVEIIFPLLLSYTNDAMTLIGKEYQLILIAFALNVDFIKNITYTLLTKILKSVSNFLEKNNNFEIQKACSVITIEIFDQIIKMGENCENAFSFIIKFFFELIEKNKAIVSQPKDNGILNGAFVIISDLLSYVININSKNNIEQNSDIKNEKIEEINRKIERDEIEKASNLNSLQKILEETLFNLINKLIVFKYPNPFLIEGITYLIDVIVYEDYKNKINELIPHLNKVLYNPDAKIYLSKIMICHLYSHLFKKMNLTEENKNIEEIIKALNYTTKDRVAKVQIAAEEALLIYNNLKKEENGEIKTKRKMSKLNLLRNLSKINKEKNNIMSSQKVRKEIYEIGIGKFLRSNDYLNNRDEENLLMLKKELNKSKEKKEKKERSRSISKKKKKFKMNSDNKLDGGIMIFQRYNGFTGEISKENDANSINDINNINNKSKSAKNNILIQKFKNDDINLNNDESIKKSLSKKEKERIETDNDNNEHEEKEKDNEINNNEMNNNEINNNEINIISKKSNNNIKIIENLNDDNDNNNNINNNNKNEIVKEKEKEEEKEEEKEKQKDLFKFQEEQNNIGDQSTPNYKEIISEKKIRNKSKKNKRKYSKENSETNEKIEKLGNSNNDLNISDNIDSSNIQGNTVEDINRINTISKRSSRNKTKNIKKINIEYNNDLFNQLNKAFNDELDKLVNDFNTNTNNKLNKINNRLLGLSQNINRIKSNFNLIKHTNNLNFKDSNVIINEEKEEQSLESSMTKNGEKYNIKSRNILWETILLYLKNENYEEAFIKALQGKDDIIFLRLIFSLGTDCLQFISINTNKLIIKHFNSIFRTFSIQNQFLKYIQAFYNMRMLNIKYFSYEELNDFMQTLFEIKSLNNDTGKQAQFLYNNILKNFSSNNY